MTAPQPRPRKEGALYHLEERRLQRRAALHGTALQDPAERRLEPPPEDGIFPDWPLAVIAAGVILLLYGALRWLS